MSQYPPKDAERAAEATADRAGSVAGAELPTSGMQGRPSAACAYPAVCAGPDALARIAAVVPDTPADDAGFEAGCYVTSVDGEPVRDIIDWRWLAAGDEIELGYIDLDGDEGTVSLWRDPGQDWGFEFDGLVFDGVRQCRNKCTFCFMRQLPQGMRRSLYLRDDDFRLSFLAGTFVTLTNLSAADEARIVEQQISPLRVSLQVVNPARRAEMIGENAAHGIEALEHLLARGIEFHAQVVLVPGQNDGAVLADTLEWAYARPGILSVGVVPLGYTRHQAAFDHSFNAQADARALLEAIAPFQERAVCERGNPWVYAADEFYRNAHRGDLAAHVPPTEHYGDFSLFEDGIGIIRATIDDWEEASATGSISRAAASLRRSGAMARMVAGFAQREFLDALILNSDIGDCFEALYVENEFFGGNVDVTGLLTGQDIAHALRGVSDAGGEPDGPDAAARRLTLVPEVIFNDDGLTLDDMTLADMEKAAGCRLSMVSCSPKEYFVQLAALVRQAE